MGEEGSKIKTSTVEREKNTVSTPVPSVILNAVRL